MTNWNFILIILTTRCLCTSPTNPSANTGQGTRPRGAAEPSRTGASPDFLSLSSGAMTTSTNLQCFKFSSGMILEIRFPIFTIRWIIPSYPSWPMTRVLMTPVNPFWCYCHLMAFWYSFEWPDLSSILLCIRNYVLELSYYSFSLVFGFMKLSK